MSGEQEPALFAVPEAYQQSAWPYVPNVQDECVAVDLDELDGAVAS